MGHTTSLGKILLLPLLVLGAAAAPDPCQGLAPQSIVSVDAALACARSVPLPTDYDFVGSQVQSTWLVLDGLYAFSDIVQDPSALDEALLYIPDAPNFKGWRPHVEPPVDWKARLRSINSTDYTNMFDVLADLVQLLGSFRDAHTALISPLTSADTFSVFAPVSFDSSMAHDAKSGKKVQTLVLASNLFGMLPQDFRSSLPPVDVKGVGQVVTAINGMEPVAFLQAVADQVGARHSPGVRFNALLQGLRFGLITSLANLGDIPTKWTIDLANGTQTKVDLDVMATLPGGAAGLASAQVEQPEFFKRFASMVTGVMTGGFNYTESMHQDQALLNRTFREAHNLTIPPPSPSDGGDVDIRNVVLMLKLLSGADPNMTDEEYVVAQAKAAAKDCGPMPNLVAASSAKDQPFAQLFNISNIPVVQYSAVGQEDPVETWAAVDVFLKAVKMGKEVNASRIVVDLSGNGGGSVAAAYSVMRILYRDLSTIEDLCGHIQQRDSEFTQAFGRAFNGKTAKDSFASLAEAEGYVGELALAFHMLEVLDTPTDGNATVPNIFSNILKGLEGDEAVEEPPEAGSAGDGPIHSEPPETMGEWVGKLLNPSLTMEARVQNLVERSDELLGLFEGAIHNPNEATGLQDVNNLMRNIVVPVLKSITSSGLLKTMGSNNADDVSYARGSRKVGEQSRFTKPVMDPRCTSAFSMTTVDADGFFFPELVFLTDGLCGSACSQILTHMMSQGWDKKEGKEDGQKVRVVSWGGTGEPIDTSSFRGGIVQDTSQGQSPVANILADVILNALLYVDDVTTEEIYSVFDTMPLPQMNGAKISFNYGEALPAWATRDQPSLPIEWLHKPAHHHWDAWYTLGPDMLFLRDKRQPGLCEAWEDVYKALAAGYLEAPPPPRGQGQAPPTNFEDGNGAVIASGSMSLFWGVLALLHMVAF